LGACSRGRALRSLPESPSEVSDSSDELRLARSEGGGVDAIGRTSEGQETLNLLVGGISSAMLSVATYSPPLVAGRRTAGNIDVAMTFEGRTASASLLQVVKGS